jgi:cytochrome c oxidase cbb3-type subunit 1
VNLLLNHIAPTAPLGAFRAGVNARYVHTLILLFFTPIGLGLCYYFLPKITGHPVYSYQLAQISFWGLIVLAGWTWMQKYMGGPLPGWMTAIGGMASLLLLVPAGIVALNLHLTTRGKHGLIETSPTLRFVFAGSFAFVVMCGISAVIGNFWTGTSMQFTHAEYGYHIIAVYAFFSMTLFGAIYYITPRLAGCEWLSARLIRNHFWFSVYGIASLAVCMLAGGLAQGQSLNSPDNWNQPVLGSLVNARVASVAHATTAISAAKRERRFGVDSCANGSVIIPSVCRMGPLVRASTRLRRWVRAPRLRATRRNRRYPSGSRSRIQTRHPRSRRSPRSRAQPQ